MNRPNPSVTTVLLARRTRALKRHLKEAVAGDGHGVHQARVASRRLREAVPVLATGLQNTKAGKARKKIRRVTKALGSIRELDVTVALLDELASRGSLPRLALEQVRAHVVKERDKRRATMTRRLEKVNLGKLERRLGSLSNALDASKTDSWKQTLSARLMKRAKRLEAAVHQAGQLYEPERLHKVRIAAKKLRYAMEVAAETGTTAANEPVRTLKRTQDILGRLHDLQVLQSHVAAVQARPQTTTLPEGGLEMIARFLEEECRHLHGRYVASVPALLAAVDMTRASVIPQLARTGAPKARSLKMDLRATKSRAGARPAPARAVNDGS
jgi:CHAD domain-containing protein